MHPSRKLPLVQALGWIVASLFLFTGGTYAYVKRSRAELKRQQRDSRYYIGRIVQTGPQKMALNTAYLAQLLHISVDRPTFFARFDAREGRKLLLTSPVIKRGEMKLLRPDTLYIDYTVRQPFAWLYDFENIALDEEKIPFPVSPFFTPKNLPEIYLGSGEIHWLTPLKGEKIELAFELFKRMAHLPLIIKRIDLSNAFAESLGRREIVLTLAEGEKIHYLRLTPKRYSQELGNYFELRPTLTGAVHVVDLRLPQLAFVH